jgi:RNA polymerase sigma-70 factor (ECF subfamily)
VPGTEPDGGALSDAGGLARAARGDADAFAGLVARHGAAVFRYARSLSDSREDAEDVLQQTFLAAWQAAGTFRGAASVRTWLLTIARNAAWRLRERRGREAIDAVPIDDLGLRAGWGEAHPEFVVQRNEHRGRVEAALARLAPEDREVLTLRELEGYSGDETAGLLGLGRAAMKSRLHRARLRLAAALREGGGDAAG